jgi:hypothetical protein
VIPGLAARRYVSGTRPYAWPWDGRLDLNRTAVLVISRRSPAGLLPPAAAVVEAAAGSGVRVVGISTGPPSDVPSGSADVKAPGWDAFTGTGLDQLLRRSGIDCLVLVGNCLETGIHSTMRSANDRGYECLLVADACEPGDPGLVTAALSMIEMSGGIFGAVGNSADVVEALTDLLGEPT